MKMRWLVLVVLVMLPMLVGACSENGDSVENAENAKKFLDAVNKTDAEEAKKYLCPDKVDNIEQIIDTMNKEKYAFKDIECQKEENSENVQCTLKLVLGEKDERDTTFSFIMENGKVCDLKE